MSADVNELARQAADNLRQQVIGERYIDLYAGDTGAYEELVEAILTGLLAEHRIAVVRECAHEDSDGDIVSCRVCDENGYVIDAEKSGWSA